MIANRRKKIDRLEEYKLKVWNITTGQMFLESQDMLRRKPSFSGQERVKDDSLKLVKAVR